MRKIANVLVFLVMFIPLLFVLNSDCLDAEQLDKIEISCNHGKLIDFSTGEEYLGGLFSDPIILEFQPSPGFEFVRWNIIGVADYQADSNRLLISSVNEKIIISVEVRNYAGSNYLPSVIDEMNVMVPGDIMVMNWSFKSADLYMNGGTWLGMPCTPLIVGDTVYVRAGSYLYSLDISSGIVKNAVKSEGVSVNYYHYISYGNGVIFDTVGHKAYDLDLDYLYDLPSNLLFVIYDNGYFYGALGAGSDNGTILARLFKTSLENDKDLVDGVKANLFTCSDTFKIFSQYGQYSSFIIENNWAFFLEADKTNTTISGYRAVTAYNLVTEEHVTLDLTELIGGMLWDDGWLYYYDGYLYLTTYVAGLFDGVLPDFINRNDAITWVRFNFEEGQFDIPYTKDIETPAHNKFKGIVSGFTINNGHGYINARSLGTETGDNGVNDEGTCLISFDIGDNGEPIPKYASPSVMTHGGVVLNIGFEEQGLRYVYLLPYNANNQGVYIFTDRLINGEWVLDADYSYIMGDQARQTFCSQGVRVGSNAQFVYYVDSGYLDCYIPVDRFKVTAIMIEEGYADLTTGYGANAGVVLSNVYKNATFIGDKMILGDKTYSLIGLNEVNGSWNSIADISKSTFSGQTRTTKAITEAYYRYVLLVAEGSDQYTSNASNSGDKGWYYLSDDHYEKVTMYSPASLDAAVGKQMFYSLTKPTDGTVVINPNSVIDVGMHKDITIPAGAKCRVIDESIVSFTINGSTLTITGLKEAKTQVIVTVNYVDYPIEIEVLPHVEVDDEGNRTIHSNREITTDDGGIVSITEDSTYNDKSSSGTKTEVWYNENRILVGTTVTISETNAEDYSVLDDSGNPTSTTCTEVWHYDADNNLVSHTIQSTQYSSVRDGNGNLRIFEVVSDADVLADTNNVTTSIRETYASFSVSHITMDVFNGGIEVSSDTKSSFVSTSEYLELVSDGDSMVVAISGDEPLDFVKLLEEIVDDPEISDVRVTVIDRLSSTAATTMAVNGIGLTMKSGTSKIVLTSEALGNLDSNSGDISLSVSANVKMTAKQQSAAGEAKVFSIELKCGDVEQHDFGGFRLSVTCDIQIQDGKELKAWRIDDYGKKTYATNVTYQNGVASFDADHLSIYAIGYESESSDEPSDSGSNGGSNGMFLYAGIGVVAVLALLGAVFVMRRRA